MVGLLVVGIVLVRVLGKTKPHVSESRAIQIAQPKIDFVPEGHTIRYVRRGIPPHGYWIVSFWIHKTGGGYKRVTVVLVDASSGRVTEVRRST
jgi:hypothetical protein